MSRTSTSLPHARSGKDLLIEELGNELVVYDARQHQAHCLTPTASVVFRLCDGRTNREAALRALAVAGLDGGEMVLDEALSALHQAGLLDADPAPTAKLLPTGPSMPSRRDVLRRAVAIAGAGVGLALVQSVVAPTVAEAGQTCGGPGQPCCVVGGCDTGLVCTPNGGRGSCDPDN